jgi:GH25 family lysozyme M1 (1,4-beta-N-acetylmuramidase)
MVNELIKKNNATPTLPIFFDIEDWTTVPDTAGATCPNDSATWAIIWNAFYNRLINLGYHENEIYIYSYPVWANKVCQDPSVYSKLRWCARYNGTFDFNDYVTGFTVDQNDDKIFGWQYSESEIIPGIYSNVTVDCGAFFNIDSLF